MWDDCSAFVYFVDEAWTPNSSREQAAPKCTSMVVVMHSILRECLSHPESAKREYYHNLHQSFAEPLNTIANLIIVRT